MSLLLLSSCVCAAPKGDLAGIKTVVDRINTTVKGLEVTVGGDVNEPVTGWILAVGSVLTIPTLALMYWLFHRLPGVKWVKTKIKGKEKTSAS